MTDDLAPPPALRERVLAAAVSRRAPRPAPIGTLVDPYGAQVAALCELLEHLDAEQWRARVPKHGDVGGLVAHLAGNDGMVSADLGLGPEWPGAPGTPIALTERWMAQADGLLGGLAGSRAELLERPVRMAGKEPLRRPLREALVQRAFETWIHADDVRRTLALPPVAPPGGQLRRIVDLAVGLLPAALAALGRARPGHTAELVLLGEGEGLWRVPLAPGETPGTPDVRITGPALAFCELVANRRSPLRFPHETEGDGRLAAHLLRTAPTLGCD